MVVPSRDVNDTTKHTAQPAAVLPFNVCPLHLPAFTHCLPSGQLPGILYYKQQHMTKFNRESGIGDIRREQRLSPYNPLLAAQLLGSYTVMYTDY